MAKKSIYKKLGTHIDSYKIEEEFSSNSSKSLEEILFKDFLPVVKNMLFKEGESKE